ncbi:MAG: imidazolonepropionase [Bacillota bacterium]|jgi:imidazolonepropionase|nr:imidazolonepropionase [Bacillota bacterium]HHT91307.1 imidazolonepropionase [Bacillota bacterium]
MKNRVKVDLLIKNGQVVTASHKEYPARGNKMKHLEVIERGWVACAGDKIVAVGSEEEVSAAVEIGEKTQVIDATNQVVSPGLIDPHTHLVFGGSREDEFYRRAQGADYMDIMRSGGGIASSVRATRATPLEDLVASARQRLNWMLRMGVTTVECKSGYGLDLDTELKQLEAVRILQGSQPIELVSTFLGAHAWPGEFKDDHQGYLDFLVEIALPRIRNEGLAEYVDVFTEKGVFSVEQSRRIFQKASELGFKLRVHADEMHTLGGAELAAEMGMSSADHLLMVSEQGIKALSESDVIPILLPGTAFALRKPYAPARKMLDAGLPLALATDFNPGSSPTANLALVMSIACIHMAMTPEEVFNAVTINAAHSLGRSNRLGSIEVGKQADLVLFDVDNYRKIPYFFGVNLVTKVIKRGQLV